MLSHFYAIGYTEALFGALSLLFLLSLHLSEQQRLSTILQLGAGAALFSLAALINLVRSIFGASPGVFGHLDCTNPICQTRVMLSVTKHDNLGPLPGSYPNSLLSIITSWGECEVLPIDLPAIYCI